MKIGFISLGCAKNQVDSEYLMGLFENPHFEFGKVKSTLEIDSSGTE